MATPSARMPAVFFGHGSPMNTLQHNRFTEAWAGIGKALPRPQAILAISAHWLTRGTAVTAMESPRTIHDFGGFPRELSEFPYPAPGDPALAERVRALLAPVDVKLDQSWGLDHGTWSVLAHVFPGADIPVVQLSMDGTQPPQYHYDLAKRLAPLRDEGVLIIGSGNVVHNLGIMDWRSAEKAYDWATRFNQFVRGHLEKGGHPALIDYQKMGKDAELSVPTSEHYLPLLYILGLQDAKSVLTIPVDGVEHGSISMLTAVVS
ncbi:MAG TPA: 4,5-DOPA dioxygenase extradiol [Burkholderiales bacterium]